MEQKDMLNQENKILKSLLFIMSLTFIQCSSPKQDYYKASVDAIKGRQEYERIHNLAMDSIHFWYKSNLPHYEYLKNGEWKLDSLICFNSTGEKAVMALAYNNSKVKNVDNDGIEFFYGIKIKERWHFFDGESIHLPRNYYQENTSIPLSFEKLHEIALKEVFGGYTNEKGEINENFFSAFEMDPYNMPAPDKETLEYRYISFCKGIWADKYAPYKKEDINFEYDPKTKEAKVSFQLQTFDSVYLPPVGYKIIYKRANMNYVDNACGAAWCEIDWKKNKIATGIIPKVEPGTDVEIYIEEDLYYDHRTKRLGPFVFKAVPKKRNEFIP